MKCFRVDDFKAGDRYRYLMGVLVPRPIAWITTVSGSGVVNLAPFSFFNGVQDEPMLVSVALGKHERLQDTLVNLRGQGEGVVHFVPEGASGLCERSGEAFASEESEVEFLGLELISSETVKVPRLKVAKCALECRFYQEVDLPKSRMIFLEVLCMQISPDFLDDDDVPCAQNVRHYARLGRGYYLEPDGWGIHRERVG